MFHEVVTARSLARLRAAELQHMPAGRLVAQVVIEGENAVHLGTREVERLRDQRDRRLRHMAEDVLQRLQDHQRRPFPIRMRGDDRCRLVRVPRIDRFHPVRPTKSQSRPTR
jgi:hypothetical protein